MNSPMENTMKLEEGKISVWYKDHERIITKRLQLPGTPRRAFPTRDDASGRDKKIKKKNLSLQAVGGRIKEGVFEKLTEADA